MQRETRANLTFMIVFLALALPGAVMLFKKKLDPTSGNMALPDSIRKRLPYMAPLTTTADVVRYIPTLAGEWVTQLTREQGAGDVMFTRGRRAVTSEDHLVQVAAINGTRVYLVAWGGGYGADASGYDIRVASAAKPITGRVAAARAIEMPHAIKREIMGGGYIAPPSKVIWLEVELGEPIERQGPLTLSIQYRNEPPASTTLQVPAAEETVAN